MTHAQRIQEEINSLYASLRDDTQAPRTVLDQFVERTIRVNQTISSLDKLERKRVAYDSKLLERYGNDYHGTEITDEELALIRQINVREAQLMAELDHASAACRETYWQVLLAPTDVIDK
jgi:hypothetical protein